jgi:hypothetical protein
MEKRKRGRPKKETPLRDKRVVIYLTEEDSNTLSEYAESLHFRSRSALIGIILERLIIGGFSPSVFVKVAFQLQRRSKQTGALKDTGLYFGLKPLPPLPDESLDPEELDPFLDEIREEASKEEETP